MTSEEYALMVRQAIIKARKDSGAEDSKVIWAYQDLADGSEKRCLGIGRRQYELTEQRQAFEDREVEDALAEARQEVLDIPAYLVQVAHLSEAPITVDLQQGIDACAHLLLILDRIAETLASTDNG
jgi:hypothetical protein